MEARRKGALRHHHSAMRTGLIVPNFLPDLHRDAEGFLTDVENSSVSSKRGNVEKVDELVGILLTKEDKDFDAFCRVLCTHGYKHWADKLRGTAQLGNGPPPTTVNTSSGCSVTPTRSREPNPNPLLDGRPTEPQLLRVTRKILPRWEDVCVYLGIPSQTIYESKQNNVNNVNQACFSALLWWRNGNCQTEANWRVLLEAMREAECVKEADEVEEKVCSQQKI